MTILVDAHAHLHPGFPLDAFLDGAWENFARIAAPRAPGTWNGCLFLSETEEAPVSARLAAIAGGGGPGAVRGWGLTAAGGVHRTARNEDGRELLLVLGLQLETDEGLEVLQIGDPTSPRGPRRDLRRTVDRALRGGCLPVVPWGFGKWTARRKEILLACLEEWSPGEVALADGAGRPAVLPSHPVLRRARRLGHLVLGGTDPLPLPSHATRAGAFGSRLSGSLDAADPWTRLRERLTEPDARPELAGRRDSLAAALVDQVRLRLR